MLSGPVPGRAQARGGAGGPAAARPVADNYFAGKTLTILVNLSAGGPTDVFARMIAQYLARHVPGNPGIVVENKTGAGGDHRPEPPLRRQSEGRPDARRRLRPVRQPVVQRPGHRIRRVEVLLGRQRRRERGGLRAPGPRREDAGGAGQHDQRGGARRPEAGERKGPLRPYLPRPARREVRYVTGYPGNADARLAMQRGEINFYSESLTGWFTAMTPLAKDGTIYPLGQTGLIKGGQVARDPRVGDIPTYPELAAELRGERIKNTIAYRAALPLTQSLSMLRAILYRPGTPPEIGEVMRQAMAETFADPEFQATSEKQVGFAMELTPGAEAEILARQIIEGGSRDDRAPERHGPGLSATFGTPNAWCGSRTPVPRMNSLSTGTPHSIQAIDASHPAACGSTVRAGFLDSESGSRSVR